MFRRCISFLVILGLVAGQLAAIPHAHAGLSEEQQRAHDAAPHLHWHGHSHGHEAHHHTHGDQNHEHGPAAPPGKDPGHESLPDGIGDRNHDATAIYIPGQGTAVAAGRQAVPSISSLVLTSSIAFGGASTAAGSTSDHWRPPDLILDGSAIYLTTRNLRI